MQRYSASARDAISKVGFREVTSVSRTTDLGREAVITSSLCERQLWADLKLWPLLPQAEMF